MFTCPPAMFAAAGPSGPSSTKWRINITADNGNTFVAATEFQFRTKAGTPLLFSGGTATSSGDNSSSFAAAYAADNNTGTSWIADTSQGTGQGWWQYTYASPVTIKEYTILPYGPATNSAPKNWTFQYWNGSAWITVDTRVNQTTWTAGTANTYTIP